MKLVKKKGYKYFFIFLIFAVFIVSNALSASASEKIKLNKKKLSMIQYKTYELELKNAEDSVKWKSSNKKIAKVNSKGKVTAVSDGKCTIIAVCDHKKYSCKVTVKGVHMSEDSLNMLSGQTTYLDLENISSSISSVKWKTSDSQVAKISKKGKVTAVGAGMCKITALYKKKKYVCNVFVDCTNVSISQSAWKAVKGDNVFLHLKNIGGNPTWKSSDISVASVSNDGNVKAVGIGDCTVYATYGGKTYNCDVKVRHFMNPGNTVVLAGSSSMDFWRKYDDVNAFSPLLIQNNAIAGTVTSQWISWEYEKIIRYNPKAVVIYVGANDIGNGVENGIGAKTAQKVISLMTDLKKELPNVPIYYVSVSPCYARPNGWLSISVCNNNVKNFCDKTNGLYFIDVASKFVKADGTPNESLFLSDNMHPNNAGYEIWKSIVAGRIKNDLK